ncbi:MAG TPA: hypothetical protein DCY35_10605 [Prolixibacteraceae bacterium]|nr:hypothetical protein [Prolixibacteraceae bacterium]
MIQEIITYIIIAAAAFLALRKFWKRFFAPKVDSCSDTKTLKTSGCGGCGADCPARQLPFKGKKPLATP